MSARQILVAPSILACDLARLQAEVDTVEQHADWLQVDVMDGHFVPNLTFGAPVIRCLKTALPLDIHLMVENPSDRIEEFLAAGAASITFHAEAVTDTAERRELIRRIKDADALAGIAISPATPLRAIEDVAAEVDLVLVMTVEPGFGGQEFLAEMLEKVRQLRRRLPDRFIQVDGGVNAETAALCRAAGADVLVAGGAVFRAEDRAAAIASLRGA